MKQKNKTILFAFAKRYLTLTLMILVTLNINAQRSGLNINVITKAQDIVAGKGIINPTMAALRTVKKAVNDIAETTKTISFNPNDIIVTHEKKVVDNIKPTTAISPLVITSTTIYDISGNSAPDQYTSLQANFVLTFKNINNVVISSLSQIIELYKLEKGATTRSFCIPAGNCTAVNIPIQISDNVSDDIHILDKGAATGKSILHYITIPSGYLSAGEYAFIDKSTLKTDGTALVCFAFKVQ